MSNIFFPQPNPLQKLETVEDFIEALANGCYSNGSFHSFKLASYDMSVISSMAAQVGWDNVAFTDRQAELAIKLVEKYTRQFKLAGIDNSVATDPARRRFRLPIRKIDRKRSVVREGDEIVVRFPFDATIIDTIQKNKKSLQGSCAWDHDRRVWRLGLTESTLNFVVTLAATNSFDVDEDLLRMFEEMSRVEKVPYKIELIETSDGFEITNAASSLKDYVEEHLGGFGPANLFRLADYSAQLGYTISDSVMERLRAQYDDEILSLMLAHRANIDPAKVPLKRLCEYAVLAQRFPVLIYCPTPPVGDYHSLFADCPIDMDRIYVTSSGASRKFDPSWHQVYFTTVLGRSNHFASPLKISYHNMNIGANRIRWLNSEGKVVYYCTQLLNPRE